MADHYSDTGTRQNTALSQAGKLVKDGSLVTGDLKVATATHTVTASDATNDVIYMVRLPVGARIIWSLSNIENDDAGTTYTAKVGIVGDDDAGGTGYALGTAGNNFLTSAAVQSTALTDNTWVIVTATSVSTPTAGKLITVNIVYAVPSH